jgi:hypothetical protein
MFVPLIELEPMWGIAAYERDGVLYSPGDPTTENERRSLELNPHYASDVLFPRGRHGMTVMFRCPVHHPRGEDCAFPYLLVPFINPLDGGPKAKEGQGKQRNHWWQRAGETFETLSLTPSIKFPEEGPEHWHGFVTNGQATP